MACDICGKIGDTLETIRDIYKTKDIQDICPACMKIVNKQLANIRSSHVKAQQSLLKRFMDVLKDSFS